MNRARSLGSLLSCLASIILVTSCSSSDAPSVGAGAGSGGATAGSSGSAGNIGISGGGAAGNNSAGSSSGGAGAFGTGGSGGSVAGNSGNAGSAGQAAPGDCSPPTDVNAPIEKLSLTGCMSLTDKTKFTARAIPYEVNSPLWSDSADKMRAMLVPVGQTVHIKDCSVAADGCSQGMQDTGKWVFPVGTVMLKTFMFDNKLVETRLFVHHDKDTWVGYSYQWDEAQTEATIVPDERRAVMFNTGTRTVSWNYPSRTDCVKCHNPMGGSTIGPQTSQMNRVVAGVNQIDKLKGMAFFDTPPSTPYQAALVTPYAGQAGMPPDSATTEQKIRSYMEANCAFCHRPDGDFTGLDLRLGTAFKDTNLCSAPLKGDVGVTGAKNLIPGQPMKSVAWLRMNALPNEGRMPQIGTYAIDTNGVKLMGDWINAASTGCP